ncbi:MAG TPA: hypothetical protein PLQ49_05705 [Methanothrix sp.]|nr:hypothetical protein [Methanothrix sp.]HRW82286.1 hypothetical protein [Methanothrix sp.]
MAINEHQDYLEYIVRNKHFINCPFLPTDKFIKYCKNRSIKTSQEQLERFEKLGIFYPIARFRYPPELVSPYKYSITIWGIDSAKQFLEEGYLWNPHKRPFQAWETFKGERGFNEVESFYSIFQCYQLYNLIESTRLCYGAEWLTADDKEKINKRLSDGMARAKFEILANQNKIVHINNFDLKLVFNHTSGLHSVGESAAIICQIISNRYYPETQSDRRSIWITTNMIEYPEWDWYEYCSIWDAESVFKDMNLDIDIINHIQQRIAFDAENVDPISDWRDLVNFISLSKKRRLKDKALLAQDLYSMSTMLQLFYEELTGEKLGDQPEWDKVQEELEALTAAYHINPRPKLILLVEGNGEEEQFPRLAEDVFGYRFPNNGIEVINVRGVGGFEGTKKEDPDGAYEKFINYHHSKNTIVFVIIDKEGRAPRIIKKLIDKEVTKWDYVKIWDKNIEFDNFSPYEISKAMTKLCENRYQFGPEEVRRCKEPSGGGDTLSELYKEKLGYGLNKPKLLDILFGFIISNIDNEFDIDGKAKRYVVEVIRDVLSLSIKNSDYTYEI